MLDVFERRCLLLSHLWGRLKGLSGEAKAFILPVVEAVEADEDRFLTASVEAPGKVAYAAKPEFKLNDAKRTRTTLGRVLARLYGFAPPNKGAVRAECDAFVEAVVTDLVEELFGPPVRFLTGPAVEEAYAGEIGGRSCMTGSDAPCTRLYADNPGAVSLVVYKAAGFTGRALLWQTLEGGKVLDRVYPSEDGNVADAMTAWAQTQGFTPRVRGHLDGDHSVRVAPPSNGCYPYVDSLPYAAVCGASLVLANSSWLAEAQAQRLAEAEGHGVWGRASYLRRTDGGGPLSLHIPHVPRVRAGVRNLRMGNGHAHGGQYPVRRVSRPRLPSLRRRMRTIRPQRRKRLRLCIRTTWAGIQVVRGLRSEGANVRLLRQAADTAGVKVLPGGGRHRAGWTPHPAALVRRLRREVRLPV